MGKARGWRLPVIAAAVAGSQLGHSIAYLARFGSAAATIETTGAHAYYPAVAAVLGGAVGGGLLVALGILAVARVVSATSRHCIHRRPVGVLEILPPLFAVQLLIFIGQESIEALTSGSAPVVLDVLIWGTIGQLPAALLGSIVVSWLLARLEAAWTVIASASARTVLAPEAAVGVTPRRCPPAASPALASAYPLAWCKRGPPHLRTS